MTSAASFSGGSPTTAKVVPYELAEIVKDLQELTDFEWEPFLLKRVSQPLDELPLEVVCALRLQGSLLDPNSPRPDESSVSIWQEGSPLWTRSACPSAPTEPSPRSWPAVSAIAPDLPRE